MRIEGDILDVNQIMRELGALVNQQGDSISKSIDLFNLSVVGYDTEDN